MSDTPAIRCPHCGAHFSHAVEGKVKLRVRLIAFGPDGRGEVHCSSCGRDVPLPVTLGESHRPKTPPPRARSQVRFVLPKGLTARPGTS